MKINVTLNGVPRTINTEPGANVRQLLAREGIMSMRNGCDAQGVCGACAIILEGKVVNSCLLVAPQIDGKKIITVDSLATNRELSPVQSAMVDAGQSVTKRLVVKGAEPFTIVSASCTDERFKCTVLKSKETLYLVSVTFTAGPTPGRVSETIRIETDQGGTVLEVPVHINVTSSGPATF